MTSPNSSTGPRTPEGKAISSQNARKHGLAAEAIPAELRPVFNDLRNELRTQCQPDGPLEEIFFDKLVTARWNMLRALDLENELYLLTDGQDPMGHPATQKDAELYNRYYTRFEGSFNRAYKQLKDPQTNRICRLIESNPEAPRPTLALADALKIQRFAKRTPVTGTAPASEPQGSVPKEAESDDILNHFPPQEAAMIREEAALCDMSVNAMVADFARLGYKTAMDEFVKNEPKLNIR